MRSVAACVASLLIATTVAGQSTNLALYQEMAVECLGDVPASIDTLALQPPDRMPYIRSALVTHWQDDGRTIYLPDSAGTHPLLSFDVEEADVTYARRSRRIGRSVVLALRYSLTSPTGRILADDRCREETSDMISRTALQVVQVDAYPETQADPPEGGWFRRYLEPVVITAATAVAVYLFFTLRSTEADDS